MAKVEEPETAAKRVALTPAQEKKLEKAEQRWEEKRRSVTQEIESAGKITEEDLAIRIVSRD